MAAALKLQRMQEDLNEEVSQSGSLVSAALSGWLVHPLTVTGSTVVCSSVMQLGPTVQINEDFHGWLVDQASALRDQRWYSLDWDNLAEELDAMARKDRNEVTSHLRNILANFLKWSYSANIRSEDSWRNTIVRSRLDLSLMLDDSATLRNGLPEFLKTAHKQARTLAASEMHLSKYQMQQLFSEECPWSIEQVRDEDFLPEVAPTANGR